MTAGTSHRESDDDYRGVVAVLNDRWRVIACRDGIQWILQSSKFRRDERAWEARSYCRTREALHRVCARVAGRVRDDAATVLANLPARIGEQGDDVRSGACVHGGARPDDDSLWRHPYRPEDHPKWNLIETAAGGWINREGTMTSDISRPMGSSGHERAAGTKRMVSRLHDAF